MNITKREFRETIAITQEEFEEVVDNVRVVLVDGGVFNDRALLHVIEAIEDGFYIRNKRSVIAQSS